MTSSCFFSSCKSRLPSPFRHHPAAQRNNRTFHVTTSRLFVLPRSTPPPPPPLLPTSSPTSNFATSTTRTNSSSCSTNANAAPATAVSNLTSTNEEKQQEQEQQQQQERQLVEDENVIVASEHQQQLQQRQFSSSTSADCATTITSTGGKGAGSDSRFHRYDKIVTSLSSSSSSSSAANSSSAKLANFFSNRNFTTRRSFLNISKMSDRLGQCSFSSGYSITKGANEFRGVEFITNGRLNKGPTYTIAERQRLGILGLLPAAVKTDDEEIARFRANLDRLKEDLDKYCYLASLQDANERLFYKLLNTNVGEFMPLVYTPVVGLACQKYSLIFQKPPRGLFITIHDKGYIYEVLRNWPEQDVRAIVVTDGERILGLGDLGANGMGIPIGKLSLYTALAGVKPSQCLPICLDVGTNTQSILDDPHYLGLRQRRVTGPQYDEFLEEFMFACLRRFGRNVLIQFEDFGNHNAFKLLEKYRNDFCTFNDDIQGTASVAVAGLLASLKVTGTRLSDHTILFQGAGEAAIGIANLCVMAMKKEGTSDKDAKSKIWLVDSKGLVVNNRPEGGVSGHKQAFAKDVQPVRELGQAIKTVKPSILIGASAIGGAFTPEIISDMAKFNKRPVIFALSNPTPKAECTAEQAYKHSDGNAIFASGSPFDPVTYKGKTYHAGQGNNAYVFPGIALGVICAGAKIIPDELFLICAQALSDLVVESDLEVGRMYPPLQQIQACSIKIARAIMEEAYNTGIATTFPKPCDIEDFIKCQMYDTSNTEVVFPEYSYPKL